MTWVTSDFPFVNIDKAVDAVKGDAPHKAELQNCKLPSVIGGEVDCLLGIKYSKLFPEIIHQLPSGLAIYRSLLMSHDGVINATIGGCHEAFEFYAGIAGGVAPLLAGFQASLKAFRDGNLPKISHLPITFEEIQTHKVMNLQFDPHEGMLDLMGEDGTFEERMEGEIAEHCELESGNEQVCNDIIVNVAESDSEEAEAEHTPRVANLTGSDLKRGADQDQAGLQVEYRCSRCRNCAMQECRTD